MVFGRCYINLADPLRDSANESNAAEPSKERKAADSFRVRHSLQMPATPPSDSRNAFSIQNYIRRPFMVPRVFQPPRTKHGSLNNTSKGLKRRQRLDLARSLAATNRVELYYRQVTKPLSRVSVKWNHTAGATKRNNRTCDITLRSSSTGRG